jgi:hypothetical protein
MPLDWNELTKLTKGDPVLIERVKIVGKDLALEGSFELPPLARLTMEDQIFATAFLRSHGSIKDMEALFGISYPTVKNRLSRISSQLDFVEINPPASASEVLGQIERGEINVEEALKKLRRHP